MTSSLNRRAFNRGLAASAAVGIGLAAGGALGRITNPPPYRGPNVIIVRFGGGVRRRETIDPEHTYSPFLRHTLTRRGVLFSDMRIADLEGVPTSHGQGTLYTVTGKYETYRDVGGQAFRNRFEASVPTLFEYFRKAYDVPAHQALLVNGEDRPDEEFFSFANHRLFGVDYRAEVLSLYRFKTYLLRRKIAAGEGSDDDLVKMTRQLRKLESFDYRRIDARGQVPEIEAFWARWRRFYGDSGFVNPRGDRLLTELTARAIQELRPRLIMVNYQDPDYVHWGNASHYTRGISVIDQGIERLVATVDADPEYRDNTVFVILPDCGRDSNSLLAVPFQHHFNSRSAHEIWALVFGPGIESGVVVDRPVDQISVAATVGRIMNFATSYAEGPVLGAVFS